MAVSLLKIELLSTAESLDSSEFYIGKLVAHSACVLPTKMASTLANDTHDRAQRHKHKDDHASCTQAEGAQVRSPL